MNKKFTKLIAALALLVFMTPTMAGWGQNLEFAPNDATTGNNSWTYVSTETEFTTGNVTFVINNWTPKSLQIRGNQTTNSNLQAGSNFYIHNTTAMPGNITGITITYTEGTIVNTKTYAMVSSSVITNQTISGSTTATAGTASISWTFDGTSPYFAIGMEKGGTSGTTKCGTITITYSTGPTQLDTPDNFAATAGNGEATFTWGAVENASSYTISYTPAGGDEATVTGISGTNSTITGLTNGTEYTCKIKAVGDGSNYSDSEYSSSVTVTPTNATFYSVNIASSITGGSVTASPLSAIAGATITLTATPSDAYTFNNIASNWNISPTVTVTPGENNTATFEMPASDVSVSATFNAKQTYAITQVVTPNNSGTIATDDTAWEGKEVTVLVEAANGYTFLSVVISKTGEPETTIETSGNANDGFTFTMPGYAVTATATFLSENYNGSFVRFENELVEGDYLIVYDGGAMNNTISSKRFGYVEVTESENNVISNPSNNIVWHIAPSETEGYWTLYNAKIGQYAASAGTSSDMSLESSATEDKALWKASGTYEFRNKGNESATTRYLRRNGTYGFANYSTSTGGALTLYKLIPNVAPAWAPEFPTNAEIITGTPYELTVSDFVTGIPTPSISITTSVSSSLYEFEDGEFMFQPSEAGTFVFTFSATNTEGSVAATLTITVNEPAQLQYVYSSNGMLGTPQSIAQGQSINSLAAGANLNDDFVFVGWTTDPSDVEHILEAGSSYTVNEATTFYAVYSRTVNVAKEKVVVLDGDAPELTSTAHALTLSENGFTYYASSAKYQALGSEAENNISTGKTILIGKQGAYLYNTTAFGQGITKFEIYANKGAALAATAGVCFSTSEISAYATGDNTWESDSDGMGSDKLYDASSVIPSGATYFWYQVTNDKNTQVQFRITYTTMESTTTCYTRVFLNETAEGNIAIVGPSIIPSGSMLDMDEYTLSNDDPANLIIEDGGQLYTENVVEATIKKNIMAYTQAANDTVNDVITYSDGWYFISSPLNSNGGYGYVPTEVLNMIPNNNEVTSTQYDLYLFDPNADKKWVNYKAHQEEGDFLLYNGHGYLYSNANNVTLEFAGSLNDPNPEISLESGYNLVGNPYAYNAYPSVSYYKMNDDHTAITADLCTDAIEPCTGIIVDNRDGSFTDITFSKNQPVGGAFNGSIQMTLAQQATNRGTAATLDNAIVSFNEGSQLGKFYFGTQNANLYIPQGTGEYAIVSSEAQGEMPVNFRANQNGEYILSVNAKNVEMNYLHLIDNMTGADVDLLANPSYTFNATTKDYESRFRLVFASNSMNAETENDNFAFFSDGNLIVSNNGEATLQVVDMTGRVVSSQAINGSSSVKVDAKAGVYVLRLINGENVRVQKIVVR